MVLAIDLGRYVVLDEIASGGMSSVHIGRMLGPAGFGRTVAVKRLHPQFSRDPEFVSMMLDEARLVSRIIHPNVVPTLDVVHSRTDCFLVMDYVHGETLSGLRRILAPRDERIPEAITLAIGANILLGLHAAHEATDEEGRPLGIIHRDISPQNVIVGTDGTALVLDFGIARAAGASHQSEVGQVKGKVAYMAPEQLRAEARLDRATDIYAASVVIWEMLTGKRLFEGTEKSQIAFFVLSGAIRAPRTLEPSIGEDLEDVVMKGLELDPERRYPTARAMAEALESCGRVATAREVAAWLGEVAREPLAERSALVARVERDTASRADVRALATKIAEGRSSLGPPRRSTPPRPDTGEVTVEMEGDARPSPTGRLRTAAVAAGLLAVAGLVTVSRFTNAPPKTDTRERPGASAPPAPLPSATAPLVVSPGGGDGPSVRPPSDVGSTPVATGQTSAAPSGGRPVAKREASPPSRPRPAASSPSSPPPSPSSTHGLFDRN